jgi:hypothetical protein
MKNPVASHEVALLEKKFIILSPAKAGSWVHTQFVLNLHERCNNSEPLQAAGY